MDKIPENGILDGTDGDEKLENCFSKEEAGLICDAENHHLSDESVPEEGIVNFLADAVGNVVEKEVLEEFNNSNAFSDLFDSVTLQMLPSSRRCPGDQNASQFTLEDSDEPQRMQADSINVHLTQATKDLENINCGLKGPQADVLKNSPASDSSSKGSETDVQLKNSKLKALLRPLKVGISDILHSRLLSDKAVIGLNSYRINVSDINQWQLKERRRFSVKCSSAQGKKDKISEDYVMKDIDVSCQTQNSSQEPEETNHSIADVHKNVEVNQSIVRTEAISSASVQDENVQKHKTTLEASKTEDDAAILNLSSTDDSEEEFPKNLKRLPNSTGKEDTKEASKFGRKKDTEIFTKFDKLEHERKRKTDKFRYKKKEPEIPKNILPFQTETKTFSKNFRIPKRTTFDTGRTKVLTPLSKYVPEEIIKFDRGRGKNEESKNKINRNRADQSNNQKVITLFKYKIEKDSLMNKDSAFSNGRPQFDVENDGFEEDLNTGIEKLERHSGKNSNKQYDVKVMESEDKKPSEETNCIQRKPEDSDDGSICAMEAAETPWTERDIQINQLSVNVDKLINGHTSLGYPGIEDSPSPEVVIARKCAWWFLSSQKDRPVEKNYDFPKLEPYFEPLPTNYELSIELRSSEDENEDDSSKSKKHLPNADLVDQFFGRSLLKAKIRFDTKAENLENIFNTRPGTDYFKTNFQAKCNLCNVLVVGTKELAVHVIASKHVYNLNRIGHKDTESRINYSDQKQVLELETSIHAKLDKIETEKVKSFGKSSKTEGVVLESKDTRNFNPTNNSKLNSSKQVNKGNSRRNYKHDNREKFKIKEDNVAYGDKEKKQKTEDDHRNKKDDKSRDSRCKEKIKDRYSKSPVRIMRDPAPEMDTLRTSAGSRMKIPCVGQKSSDLLKKSKSPNSPDLELKRKNYQSRSRSRSKTRSKRRCRSRSQSVHKVPRSPLRQHSPHVPSRRERKESKERKRENDLDKEYDKAVHDFLTKTLKPSQSKRSRPSIARSRSNSPISGRANNKEFCEKLILTAEGKWNDHLESTWKLMEAEVAIYKETKSEAQRIIRLRPESHHMYEEEWAKFWERRYSELLESNEADPEKYDYVSEWKVFWTKRLNDLFKQEMEIGVNELKRKHGMDLDSMRKRRFEFKTPVLASAPLVTDSTGSIALETSDYNCPNAIRNDYNYDVPEYKKNDSNIPSLKVKKTSDISNLEYPESNRTKMEKVTVADIQSQWESLIKQPTSSQKSYDSSSVDSQDYDGFELVQVLFLMVKMEDYLSYLSTKVMEYYKQAEDLEEERKNKSFKLLRKEELVIVLFQCRDKLMTMIKANILPRDTLKNMNMIVYALNSILETPQCQKFKPQSQILKAVSTSPKTNHSSLGESKLENIRQHCSPKSETCKRKQNSGVNGKLEIPIGHALQHSVETRNNLCSREEFREKNHKDRLSSFSESSMLQFMTAAQKSKVAYDLAEWLYDHNKDDLYDSELDLFLRSIFSLKV